MSNGVIAMNFVRPNKNLIDPVMKGLYKNAVQETLRGMGLKPI